MKIRAFSLPLLVLFASSLLFADSLFHQTNLVSDGAVAAKFIDPDLKNPWGIAFAPTSPFWVADNGTDKSTLYNGLGTKQGLVVSLPPSSGPTGVVFNSKSTDFNGDLFVFAAENGTINGWRGALGTNAETLTTTAGASYTGLASGNDKLFAANFAQGRIDVFNSSASLVASTFTDPNLPAGYSPFNIQNIGGLLYVTYAPTAGGPGGIVDVFDLNGNLVRRLISGGALDNPWGLVIAPSGFGDLGGDLLVGNFGNGEINAYDLATGSLIRALTDENGNTIVNHSLWALAFGNGGTGFDANTLYFTAGLENEDHGLFASLTAVPEPSTMLLIGSGLMAGAWKKKKSRS